MIVEVLMFVIVAVVIYLLVQHFAPGAVVKATAGLPTAAKDVAQSVSSVKISAANVATNLAVDAIDLDLKGIRRWITSADQAKQTAITAALDLLAAENETYRTKEPTA